MFIAAEDVLEIEFCCSNDRCNARVSIPLDKGINLPATCPSCNMGWFMPYKDDGRKEVIYAFVDSIKKMRDLKEPFTLRMRVFSDREGA